MLTEFASKKLKPNYFLEEDTETLRNWLIERQEMYFCDPNYMSSQPFFNTRMRTTLIDWLIEVIFQVLIKHYLFIHSLFR